MPIGTASARLKKSLLWDYIVKAGDNMCFQCGEEISSSDDLSVEHKIPYLHSDDPVGLFFSIENIAYSHLSCNVSVARRTTKVHKNAKEKSRVNSKKYWDSLGKEGQRKRRRKNYERYGC